MDRLMIDYLPPVVREVRELRAIAHGQQDVFTAAWDAVGDVFNDQFVDDSTKNGISRWEKILDITPKESETLEARRFRIRTRLNERLPFTLPVLSQRLADLCGADGYSLEMDNNTGVLYVKVSLAAKSNLADVDALLKRVVPANVTIDLELKYATHEALSGYTHEELSAYTHDQLRNEVMTNA